MSQPDFCLDLFLFLRMDLPSGRESTLHRIIILYLLNVHPFMGLENPTWNPPHTQVMGLGIQLVYYILTRHGLWMLGKTPFHHLWTGK